ncbi:aminotransferase class IV [Sedimentisphaera salicampi]|uniref:D-alanine aminotransferase n=1 Tax=Sedimentisphaera salicampi TaxID=1941349 RepID=A0A1W6LKZ6_9BACT|nr:aminotransferase class IV [Sedimentisphaera salicampi]ARN56435.1 D-alanine aminotransferase [Sedimentisphaera salicampi]OXU15323.1 D-alanine aminotransferase [Sedimentisphaera salicampi]
MELAVIQDRTVPLNELDSSFLDRGLFFGDGVYEVMRTYSGRLFALDEHLERLERSLREIWIVGVDIPALRARIIEAYKKTGIDNCCIYLHITRGSAPRSHAWPEGIKPNIFMMFSHIEGYERLHRDGVKVLVAEDLRWKRCDIKSLNLLPNAMAKKIAHDNDCFEAILTDRRGDITEGASSAFFAVFNRMVVTRPLSNKILPSISRMFVRRAVENCGLEFAEKTLNPLQAAKADELFLAVTTKDIVGITDFHGKQISGGKVGRITKMLQESFAEIVKKNALKPC